MAPFWDLNPFSLIFGYLPNFITPQSRSGSFSNLHCHHQHHHRLYSPMWALASSRKCRQRPLSWTSARQFLQPSFLASSSTPSIHLEFGLPHPRWPPQFVYNIFLGNSLSSIRTTCSAHLSLLDFITLYLVHCKAVPVLCCISSATALPSTSDHIFCEGFSFRKYSVFFHHFFFVVVQVATAHVSIGLTNVLYTVGYATTNSFYE